MNKTKSIAPLCLLFVACQDEPEHDDTPDVEYRSVTAHDAGDVSFVRQAVPALLGRKVSGILCWGRNLNNSLAQDFVGGCFFLLCRF